MASKLLTAIVKRIRKLVFSLTDESEKTTLDEYVLEHLLLYHGLVGSSPENQRSFQEVRSEVRIAVENRNALQIGIAIKLPPLWWEDKLRTIFGEIMQKEGSERAIAALHPQPTEPAWPTRLDPLGHNDWHVRANAASILAFLNARVAVERMSASLRDSASGAKGAFCHIAYALGRLGADQGRAVLEEFLYCDEPWFRVDAAGALAHWPMALVGETLMQSMLSHHQLSDYMAVAISRKHSPAEFLQSTHAAAREGACAMVLGLLEASQQTFSNDVIADSKVLQCTQQLFQLAIDDPTPLNMRAALSLAQWIRANDAFAEAFADDNAGEEELAKLEASLSRESVDKVVNRNLAKAQTVVQADSTEMRQAIGLAGDFKLASALPVLTSMLRADNPLLDPTIEAVGRIGDPASAEPLISLGQHLVEMSQRTAMPLSKQPIAEDNARACNSYWHVLKALGDAPNVSAISYLLEATADYAPDKREQALNSLISVYKSAQAHGVKYKEKVTTAVMQALTDPAAQVRVAALDGIALIGETSCIAEVIKLIDSAEISVGRKALSTLQVLADQGDKKAVSAALTEAIRTHSDDFRRKQLTDFLATLTAKK